MSDNATVTVKVKELTSFLVALLSSVGDNGKATIRGGTKKSDSEKEILYGCEIYGEKYAGVIGIIPCWKLTKSSSLYPILTADSVLLYVNHFEGPYVQTLPLIRDSRLLKEIGYAQE